MNLDFFFQIKKITLLYSEEVYVSIGLVLFLIYIISYYIYIGMVIYLFYINNKFFFYFYSIRMKQFFSNVLLFFKGGDQGGLPKDSNKDPNVNSDPDPKDPTKLKKIIRIILLCVSFSVLVYLLYQIYVLKPTNLNELNWLLLSALMSTNQTSINIENLNFDDWVFIRQNNLFSWVDTSYSFQKLTTLNAQQRDLIRELNLQVDGLFANENQFALFLGSSLTVGQPVTIDFDNLPFDDWVFVRKNNLFNWVDTSYSLQKLSKLTVDQRNLIRELNLQVDGLFENETLFQRAVDLYYINSCPGAVTEICFLNPKDPSKEEITEAHYLTMRVPWDFKAVQRLYDLTDNPNERQALINIVVEQKTFFKNQQIDTGLNPSYYLFPGVDHEEAHCYVPYPEWRPGPVEPIFEIDEGYTFEIDEGYTY